MINFCFALFSLVAQGRKDQATANAEALPTRVIKLPHQATANAEALPTREIKLPHQSAAPEEALPTRNIELRRKLGEGHVVTNNGFMFFSSNFDSFNLFKCDCLKELAATLDKLDWNIPIKLASLF